jgi:maltoporin
LSLQGDHHHSPNHAAGRFCSWLLAAALVLVAPAALAQPEPTPDPPATAEPRPDPPPEVAPPVAPKTTPEPAPPANPPGAVAAPRPPAVAPVTPTTPPAPAQPVRVEGFTFGSYGRIIAATDARGRPGRDADLVAHGSRLDESNYAELELRRDDYWKKTDTSTNLVVTLAFANPIFHYDGDFDVKMAIRNLYLEERDLGLEGLSVWAGSRMYRGDDIYLLDWWALDNLNTVGAGARYDTKNKHTSAAIHGGLGQPDSSFFHQSVLRPPAQNQFGATEVEVLDRQKFIGSLKVSHIIPVAHTGGLKGVAYAEMHRLPAGQRETDPSVFQTLPSDDGYVIGAQIGAFTGERDTHVNLSFRYARGVAAFGEFASPGQLQLDLTTSGAHEFVVALGGNWETGPFGVMLGAYVRTFRDASPALNFEDVDEGIIAVRPHIFFGEIAGLAVEGSYQVQQRGVLASAVGDAADTTAPTGPLSASLVRFGFIPFLSPAGRGDYSRPHLRLIYLVTLRDEDARALYPQDDVFGLRDTEHFFGIGAEWWFNSSSYGG